MYVLSYVWRYEMRLTIMTGVLLWRVWHQPNFPWCNRHSPRSYSDDSLNHHPHKLPEDVGCGSGIDFESFDAELVPVFVSFRWSGRSWRYDALKHVSRPESSVVTLYPLYVKITVVQIWVDSETCVTTTTNAKSSSHQKGACCEIFIWDPFWTKTMTRTLKVHSVLVICTIAQ